MLIKSLKILLAGIALGTLGACSTPMPCDPTGPLCAPDGSNTRATLEHERADQPQVLPNEPAPPPADVVTAPIDTPNALPPGAPSAAVPNAKSLHRIGLLLPLHSPTLGGPAEAVRAGFMAAWERDGAGFVVNLVETGDSVQDTYDGYSAAAAQNDIVVGPLGRSAVAALASSAAVTKPTIALNHPEPRAGAEAPLPDQMLAMGLSIEDEARQVADWANAEQPGGSALIVSGTNAWQRRIANAFAAEWRRLGHNAEVAELPAAQGFLGGAAVDQLRARIDSTAPTLLFTALDAEQARLLRGALHSDLPWYGTSSVNPGAEPGMAVAELDGIRVLDMPWEVNPAHPAVMVYPRWNASAHTLDMDRLYALGIDAFRVAREIALHPASSFRIDGVTGRLSVSFGEGPARFERIQPPAVYEGGAFRLVTDGR